MTGRADPLRGVVLAVASFRKDDAVLALLERVGAATARFARVVVVDSLGTGALERRLRERGLHQVDVETARVNLGSAGNLARRLTLAAEGQGRWVLAVNHDGLVEPARVEALVRAGEGASGRVGAVYPARRMVGRGGVLDLTGTRRVPWASRRVAALPSSTPFDVYWSTSNGALYSLEPVRRGLLPPAELWMGWEDLAYGWLLHREGWRQLQVPEACIDDGYEYRRVGGTHVADKAPWYAYYGARNLLLAARLTRQPAWVHGVVAARLAAEACVTVALRDRKRERLRNFVEGVRDGLLGRTGQWRLP